MLFPSSWPIPRHREGLPENVLVRTSDKVEPELEIKTLIVAGDGHNQEGLSAALNQLDGRLIIFNDKLTVLEGDELTTYKESFNAKVNES